MSVETIVQVMEYETVVSGVTIIDYVMETNIVTVDPLGGLHTSGLNGNGPNYPYNAYTTSTAGTQAYTTLYNAPYLPATPSTTSTYSSSPTTAGNWAAAISTTGIPANYYSSSNSSTGIDYNTVIGGSGVSAESNDSSGTTSGDNHPPTATILKGVLSTIGALAIIMTIWFCYRRAKIRRREKREREEEDQEKVVGRNAEATSPTATDPLVTGLFDNDPFNIRPIPPPPPVRYSTLSNIPRLPSFSSVALPPRATERSGPSRSSTISSSWADDSEIDAFATDGSSLARTISTYSTGSIRSDRTVTRDTENPFDHPAYTLMSSRPRTLVNPSSTNGSNTLTSSADIATSGLTPIYQAQNDTEMNTNLDTRTRSTIPSDSSDPFADSSAPNQSPTSTMTSIHLDAPSTPRQPDFDEIFGGAHTTPAMNTETTFIHHIDGGRAPSQRAGGQPEPDRVGGGEVHIPPTYMELYPARR